MYTVSSQHIHHTHIHVADAKEMESRLAGDFIDLICAQQDSGVVPTVVLTGGSMGIAMLRAAHEHPDRARVKWGEVNILWGDERWLPTGDAERNEKQADDALLRDLPLDASRVYRVAASDSGLTLDEAAAQYSETVQNIGDIHLVLLGVGPDGHVASLFPGREEINERGDGALAIRNSPKPPPERVSLKLETLSRADQVWLLISGAPKHNVFARSFPQIVDQENEASPDASLPASRVQGASETRVYTDEGAFTGN